MLVLVQPAVPVVAVVLVLLPLLAPLVRGELGAFAQVAWSAFALAVCLRVRLLDHLLAAEVGQVNRRAQDVRVRRWPFAFDLAEEDLVERLLLFDLIERRVGVIECRASLVKCFADRVDAARVVVLVARLLLLKLGFLLGRQWRCSY